MAAGPRGPAAESGPADIGPSATPVARAFDLTRPPEQSLIDDCVHCGMCLETCPTYSLWGEEMDSPRGRIVLMQAGLEEGSKLSVPMVRHLDNCLGCMACVTACPSGVKYDRLIEDTRAQVERRFPRSLGDRLFRRFLFATFTHPRRLRMLAPGLALGRLLRLPRLAARSRRLGRRFPRLRSLALLAPRTPLRESLRRLPERMPADLTATRRYRSGASTSPRARVGFLQGCVQRVFFDRVNRATGAVLAAEGYEVFAPSSPRCCGALGLHAGRDQEARELARRTISAFEGCDFLVTNAAGCGSAIKDYGHVLRDDPEWAERAAALSERARDVSELLADDPIVPRQPLPLRVAYHDACHLAHAQGLRAAPRRLLQTIPGLELIEPDGWEICCGSAGVYNLLQPEPAAELGRRKAEALLATGTRVVAAANPGCSLQIAAHAELRGQPLEVVHPIELVAASIEGAPIALEKTAAIEKAGGRRMAISSRRG